jgi:Txe/YoeB family toxin of Txe-Axe toxin-antitoxin module
LQIDKQNETQIMQQKYQQEMNTMREQMNQIMSMIQQNPSLAQVKPEALVNKRAV